MMRRLIQLIALLIDGVKLELAELALPRQAAALGTLPICKAPKASTTAIIANFQSAKAKPSEEHARFDDLFFGVQTAPAGFESPERLELMADFRRLGTAVAAALKRRVSEQEICSWQFHDTLVSPAFVKQIQEKITDAQAHQT